MQFTNQALTFHSDAVAPNTFQVAAMTGEERMSGLFRFELDLISTEKSVDLEGVLYAPAKLGIKVVLKLGGGLSGSTMREVTGVLAEFEQKEVGQEWVKYRAVLVPKLWLLSRNFRSRIFMNTKNGDGGLTVDELVGEVLEGDGLQPDLDYEFKLAREDADKDKKPPERWSIYPKREYVVQYEETDWQFVSRWLEHEGIYYYFVNTDGDEKVVFADTESGYAAPPFASSYPYRPGSVGDGAESDQLGEEEVHVFSCRQTRLPEKVVLNDYNWRTPSAQMYASEEVRKNGTGFQMEYNDHYKTLDQGKALAVIRKEELTCRSRVFSGASTCRGFRPGSTFELEEHYRDDFNRTFLLTAVHHEAEQMISMDSASVTGVKYSNTFEAIPDDQAFRPECVTPWPSIKGVMHGKIDAEKDKNGEEPKYAILDEHGRYTVRIPFDQHVCDPDEEGPKDGHASRWIRMAQPYAGEGAGFHFPLRKGTEVLITHVDGDPDRPVISGAVPNPDTKSPTTSANPRPNTIHTASGNVVQIDDDEKASGFRFVDTTGGYVADMRRPNSGAAPAAAGLAAGGGSASPTPRAGADDESSPSPSREPKSELPSGGQGNTAAERGEKNTGGYDGGETTLSDAWNSYVGGSALSDTTTAGRYRDQLAAFVRHQFQEAIHDPNNPSSPAHPGEWDDSDGLKLSDIRAFKADGGPGAAPPDPRPEGWEPRTFKIDDTTLKACLTYLLKYHARNNPDDVPLLELLMPDPSAEIPDAADLLDSHVSNLVAEAFGSRIRAWVGDDIWVRVGDKYTYADVARDVSIGTGGKGIKYEHGDTDDESYQYGDALSWSHYHGAKESHERIYGGSSSDAFTAEATASSSIKFGAAVSFSFEISEDTSCSIWIGNKNKIDVKIGLESELSIYASASAKFELGAAASLAVAIKTKSTEVEIPDMTTVKLRKQAIALMEDDACMTGLKAVLKNTDLVVGDTKTCIKESKAGLDMLEASLSTKKNILSEMKNTLSSMKKALSRNKQVAVESTQAGVQTNSP